MNKRSAFHVVAILLGVSLCQHVLGQVPPYLARFETGTTATTGGGYSYATSVLASALGWSESDLDLIPWDRGEAIREANRLSFDSNVFADSTIGPATSTISGTRITVTNPGLSSMALMVSYETESEVSGRNAFTNTQFSYACILECQVTAGGLDMTAPLLSAYRSARQASGNDPGTMPAFDTFLFTYDSLFGTSFFSGTTGKIDINAPKIMVSMPFSLPPGASVTFGTDNNATAVESATAQNLFQLSITTPIPEPEAYGMMLVGLGLVGLACRRQRRSIAGP